MRSRPKDGIEDRQYLRQNVVASVRGFPRQGGLRVGQEGMPKLDFQPLLREQRSELAEFYPKGKQTQPSTVTSEKRRLPVETCLLVANRARWSAGTRFGFLLSFSQMWRKA